MNNNSKTLLDILDKKDNLNDPDLLQIVKDLKSEDWKILISLIPWGKYYSWTDPDQTYKKYQLRFFEYLFLNKQKDSMTVILNNKTLTDKKLFDPDRIWWHVLDHVEQEYVGYFISHNIPPNMNDVMEKAILYCKQSDFWEGNKQFFKDYGSSINIATNFQKACSYNNFYAVEFLSTLPHFKLEKNTIEVTAKEFIQNILNNHFKRIYKVPSNKDNYPLTKFINHLHQQKYWNEDIYLFILNGFSNGLKRNQYNKVILKNTTLSAIWRELELGYNLLGGTKLRNQRIQNEILNLGFWERKSWIKKIQTPFNKIYIKDFLHFDNETNAKDLKYTNNKNPITWVVQNWILPQWTQYELIEKKQMLLDFFEYKHLPVDDAKILFSEKWFSQTHTHKHTISDLLESARQPSKELFEEIIFNLEYNTFENNTHKKKKIL